MGVTGLWRLIEPAGKPVPVETLENKVLAVDISIWLHQIVKGYQDTKGAPVPNAHLIGLFQRLCKLLYFRVKPVFVFDGGFPDLKKDTIGKRNANKAKYNSESERIKRELTIILGKKTAIGSLLGQKIPAKRTNTTENSDDIFKLPALPEKDQDSESESEDEKSSSASSIDLHTVDLESEKIKNLPTKEKYDLLIELKETRKMNSWGKLHTLPKKSDNFSDFQMQRLLKRRKLQECLEETEKEMGEGSMSLNELESLLNEEGIDTKIESLPNRRIASNEKSRFLLISDVKQALAEAKKKDVKKNSSPPPDLTEGINRDSKEFSDKTDELEDDLQKAIKMSLECVDDKDASASTSKTDESWTSNFTESEYSDSEDEDSFVQSDISSAKAYIMQYTDLTNKAIDEIVSSKQKGKKKNTGLNVDKIIEELNSEKSIIAESIDLSASENYCKKSISPAYQTSVTTGLKTNLQITKDTQDKVTETSVICLEEDEEVIQLDTSTEEISLDEKSNKHTLTEMSTSRETYKSKTFGGDILTPAVSVTQNEKNLLNYQKDEIKKETFSENLSESSEDDFEEVADDDKEEVVADGKFKVPVVQLTLSNINEKIEDDIFADVFDQNIENSATNVNNCNMLHIVEVPKIGSPNESAKNDVPVIVRDKHMISKSQEGPEEIKPFKEPQTTSCNSNILKKKINSIVLDVKGQESLVYEKSILDPVDNHVSESTSEKNPVPDKSNTFKLIENNGVNSRTQVASGIFKDKLNEIALDIQEKEDNLVQEKSRLDRVGRNITEQITKDAQELLQIFGVPYIVAPMEAEAQCAFLETVKLTDGTITDDSDIWLFGGQTVYKNFFNQKKHVLQYLSERIEKSFNLTREQLILLALLVGSDYTTGINGVGPVTALEILASFPFNKKKMLTEQSKQAQYQEMVTGLIDFKKWVRAGKRTDNTSLKKKLKNVSLTDDFPSIRVVQAYLEPNVEKSEENFTWGNIDVTILRDYTKSKFGWSQNKLDEIIKPVLKRIQDRKSQKSVQDYFKRKTEFNSLEDQMSKRVKAAVQKIGPHQSASDPTSSEETKNIRKKKRDSSVSSNTDVASTSKRRKNKDNISTISQVVKTQELHDTNKKFSIDVSKSQTAQEIIPQREKDKQNMLQNKLKAIEMFRKNKIDRKTRTTKRKLPKPKDDAELSESSDSN